MAPNLTSDIPVAEIVRADKDQTSFYTTDTCETG